MSAKHAFVVGWPVEHSRSPLIHRFWLDRYKIDGDYRREAVPPQCIETFLQSTEERGYVGGNVTIPHKEAAFRACRRTAPVARQLRAANTLWLERHELCGDNTDAYGFAANLDERAPGWRSGGSALVIGAGGAARAIIYALLEAGFRSVIVLNRTTARAEALAELFGAAIQPGGLHQLSRALPRADLIVNATSTGMAGEQPLEIAWQLARDDAIATDLVYVPLLTPFLQGAAKRGLKTVDGLGMLLYQAVPGFERWFGVRPIVDADLRRLIAAEIGG
jgi:shikimate dehydrogenase